MTRFFFSALVLIFLVIIQKGFSLKCWSCSTDLDYQCKDPFNTTEMLRYSGSTGGNYYQSQNQNFNNQQNANNQPNYNGQPNYNQRSFDSSNPNYPRDYSNQNQNPNYNRQGFNQGYSNQAGSFSISGRSSNIQLVNCDEDEARRRRMKNVCLKKVHKNANDIYTVIRRCETVAVDRSVGTCDDPVARGISLEFCEYCDYDGCNSATSLKTSVILASLVPVVLFLFFRN